MSKKLTLTRLTAIAAFVGGAAFATGASAGVLINWTPWAVQGAGTSTTVNGDGSVTFNAEKGGANLWASGGGRNGGKAFYSTDSLNGYTIGDLDFLRYTCDSGCTDPANNLGMNHNGPYTNINVVDPTNTNNRAQLLVIINIAGGIDTSDIDFQLSEYQVGEATSAWISGILTYAQAKNLIITDPSSILNTGLEQPLIPGSFCAASATGCDDGIWLVWGNKSGADFYTGTDVTISGVNLHVPEPGTVALLGLGLAGLGFSRRKK